jgi:TIR domain
MGFTAPSADEVYAYLFRADSRGLTDRFSWSVLFVNDHSPVCAEFLSRYAVDLCARTADRIRFVFFSGLTDGKLQRIAARQNDLGPPWSSWITRILAAMPFRYRLDYERAGWRELRPRPLRPLRDSDEVAAHLDWLRVRRTAMPGADEALLFAQRLGIGRLVPCLVFFTDIGELRVRVLPFAGRGPGEVYDRLRGWIDTYYEQNRHVLEHWRAIEDQILRLARDADWRLREIQAWPQRRREQWRWLARTAGLIRALSTNLDVARSEIHAIAADYSLPMALRSAIDTFATRLAEYDAQEAACAACGALADRVATEADPERLHCLLLQAAKDQQHLSADARTVLSDAAEALVSISAPVHPDSHLYEWWRHNALPLVSRKQFRRWCANLLPSVPGGRDEAGARWIRQEYEAFRLALGRLPLSATSEQASKAVVVALAAQQPTEFWRAGAERLGPVAAEAFQRLQNSAPAWLRRLGPDLLLSDCVPIGERSDDTAFGQFIANTPELAGLLDRLRSHRAEPERRYPPNSAVVRDQRDKVVATLREQAGALAAAAGDRAAASAATSVVLEEIHARLAAELDRDVADGPPSQMDGAAVAHLNAALDDYDAAVSAIRYPYLDDPSVIAIRTDPIEAAGLAPATPEDRVTALRAELSKAATADDQIRAEGPGARREGSRWTPAAVLRSALDAALPPERIAEILAPTDPLLTTRHEGGVLAALTRAELVAVAAHAVPDLDAASLTLNELRCAVLISAGLRPDDTSPPDPNLTRLLANKIRNNQFDVFLAYNSADRTLVVRVSEQLRRHGIYPWVDVDQIRPGDFFQDAIQATIRRVRRVAVFLGVAGPGPWQRLELRIAISRCVETGVVVVPVLLPGVVAVPEDLPFLAEFEVVRFEHSVTEGEPLGRLIRAVTGERPSTQ